MKMVVVVVATAGSGSVLVNPCSTSCRYAGRWVGGRLVGWSPYQVTAFRVALEKKPQVLRTRGHGVSLDGDVVERRQYRQVEVRRKGRLTAPETASKRRYGQGQIVETDGGDDEAHSAGAGKNTRQKRHELRKSIDYAGSRVRLRWSRPRRKVE